MKSMIPAEIITGKIHLIRDHKILLDRDLAELYGIETRTLKQAVRRNIKRFPDDFMFELSRDEEDTLRSQTKITNCDLKRKREAFEISFICLYRTGCSHAHQRLEK